MRKIILYIAASLDSYIARENGDIDWLHDATYTIKGEDFGYNQFIKSIDTTLMGNSTYKVVLGFDMPFPYPDKENYVFSKSAHTQQDTEFVKYVREDAVAFIKKLKQQQGNNIWLMGGGQLNTLFLNEGLIDEMILTYIPIVLGSGIPLFAAGAQERKLSVLESKSFENGFVQVKYAAS